MAEELHPEFISTDIINSPRQRLIRQKDPVSPESSNINNSPGGNKIIMADLVQLIFRKKTFFILITVLCVGALIAAIVASVLLNKSVDPLACLNEDTDVQCDSEKERFYRFYGTKTDYIDGKGPVPDEIKPPSYPGCEEVQIYLFSRHAIRYPDAEGVVAMESILYNLRDDIVNSTKYSPKPLCNETIKGLENWQLKMVKEDDNRISITGQKQSKELGERLKQKFPSLFYPEYSPTNYTFGYTSRTRTLETAKAFASGIFDEIPELPPGDMDTVLNFHKDCDKILKKNKGFSKTKPAEELLFLKSKPIEDTLNDLSNRLQINATMDIAKLMLRTCQFEYSIYGSSSWCALFSKSNLKVFEYLEDLNDYYSDGYGLERNHKQACRVVEDIVKMFKLAKQGYHPKAVLLFSHAGAVKKVAAHLSLFKDDHHLLAGRYCQNADRKWRSSRICPFNGNFYMVLYKCDEQYKVLTYYNEKLVTIGGCSSEFCPWEEFEKRYDATCDLDDICKIK